MVYEKNAECGCGKNGRHCGGGKNDGIERRKGRLEMRRAARRSEKREECDEGRCEERSEIGEMRRERRANREKSGRGKRCEIGESGKIGREKK